MNTKLRHRFIKNLFAAKKIFLASYNVILCYYLLLRHFVFGNICKLTFFYYYLPHLFFSLFINSKSFTITVDNILVKGETFQNDIQTNKFK